MSNNFDPITRKNIEAGDRYQGLVFDFKEQALLVPERNGYLALPDRGWSQSPPERRLIDAETRLIATYDDVDQTRLPDILGFGGLKVKRSGDMHVALPQSLSFVAGRINAASGDALKLYGPDLFESAEFVLIVKRGDIQPGDLQHAEHTGEFHTHLGSSDGRTTDVMYSFLSNMGTETRFNHHEGRAIEPVVLAAPDCSVTRMGGDIEHRAPTNHSEDIKRREWGTMVSYLNPAMVRRFGDGMAINRGVIDRDHEEFEACKIRAADVLAAGERIRVLDTPQSLIEHAGVEVQYIEDEVALS